MSFPVQDEKKMKFYKHSVRLFVMQRKTSYQIAPGLNNYDTRQQYKARYLSTEVLPEEEQSGLFGKKLNERQRAAREKFLEAEKEWDKTVKWDSLNEDEIEIVTAHKRAVLSGHFTYDDTKLEKKVTTRLRHFLRGSCCGNGCRHVCEIFKLGFSHVWY